ATSHGSNGSSAAWLQWPSEGVVYMEPQHDGYALACHFVAKTGNQKTVLSALPSTSGNTADAVAGQTRFHWFRRLSGPFQSGAFI
ncbi:hypothetical protein, partial [Phyllobacterium lublinensis]|uniref:hypothetical protein n=1 Tax=Phyllobacterium lublinensis TaxID=2875708 RepID=UPI001CC90898